MSSDQLNFLISSYTHIMEPEEDQHPSVNSYYSCSHDAIVCWLIDTRVSLLLCNGAMILLASALRWPMISMDVVYQN